MSSRYFLHIFISLLCIVSSVVNQTTKAEHHDVDHSFQSLDEERDTDNTEGGKCNISECGRSHEEKGKGFPPLIINGQEVKPINKYPWMVSLLEASSKRKLCAGVILNEYYILTAAHCLLECLSAGCENYPPAEVQVEFLSPASTAAVEQIISHPEFSVPKISTHDVALLKMKSPIECDSYKSPICLPTAEVLDIQPGLNFTISGWGRTKPIQEEDPEEPTPLKEAVLSAVDNEMCIGGDTVFEDSNICLVGGNGTPCKGDSGGPMFYKIDGIYYTFGIASSSTFVAKMCELNSTVIYAKVSTHLDWIVEQIGQVPMKVLMEDTTANATVTEQTT